MNMAFTVTYDDGREVRAVTTMKDIVAFERQYGQSLASFGNGTAAPLEWLLYLAWSPLHRQGREPRAFDEFLDSVEDISPVEDEPAVPFDPAVSAAPSVGSQ